jgi:hypothetical protein
MENRIALLKKLSMETWSQQKDNSRNKKSPSIEGDFLMMSMSTTSVGFSVTSSSTVYFINTSKDKMDNTSYTCSDSHRQGSIHGGIEERAYQKNKNSRPRRSEKNCQNKSFDNVANYFSKNSSYHSEDTRSLASTPVT